MKPDTRRRLQGARRYSETQPAAFQQPRQDNDAMCSRTSAASPQRTQRSPTPNSGTSCQTPPRAAFNAVLTLSFWLCPSSLKLFELFQRLRRKAGIQTLEVRPVISHAFAKM
eukprot:5788515-Amphidinium_carterae.1